MESAFNVIIDRHEVLRSTIKIIDEMPHAVIHESWPLRFKKIDLSTLPQEERQAEIDRLLIEEPRVPYDLVAEPGIRVTLLRLRPWEHVLILMMHHIVCDWSSEGIIWRGAPELYSCLSAESRSRCQPCRSLTEIMQLGRRRSLPILIFPRI